MTNFKKGDRARANDCEGTITNVRGDLVCFKTDDECFEDFLPFMFLTKIEPVFEKGERVLVEMIIDDVGPIGGKVIKLEFRCQEDFYPAFVDRRFVRKFRETEDDFA